MPSCRFGDYIVQRAADQAVVAGHKAGDKAGCIPGLPDNISQRYTLRENPARIACAYLHVGPNDHAPEWDGDRDLHDIRRIITAHQHKAAPEGRGEVVYVRASAGNPLTVKGEAEQFVF
jgi:hypothetical protein